MGSIGGEASGLEVAKYGRVRFQQKLDLKDVIGDLRFAINRQTLRTRLKGSSSKNYLNFFK